MVMDKYATNKCPKGTSRATETILKKMHKYTSHTRPGDNEPINLCAHKMPERFKHTEKNNQVREHKILHKRTSCQNFSLGVALCCRFVNNSMFAFTTINHR
jgi:hypothetical protein